MRLNFKSVLFKILVLHLFSFSCIAQDSIKRMESPQKVHTVIKTNPAAILWGTMPYSSEFRFVLEQAVHPHQSAQIGFSILRKSPLLFLVEDSTLSNNDKYVVKGWRFQISHRFYAGKKIYSPYGLYISPFLSMASEKFSTRYYYKRGVYYKGFHYNASLHFGAQAIIFRKFAIDIFTGLGYQDKRWTENHDKLNIHKKIEPKDIGVPFISPIKITAGFNIGLAF